MTRLAPESLRLFQGEVVRGLARQAGLTNEPRSMPLFAVRGTRNSECHLVGHVCPRVDSSHEIAAVRPGERKTSLVCHET